MKIISFCLWGDDPKYTTGLLENLRLAKEYYPTWLCWIYTGNVSEKILEKIREHDNAEIFPFSNDFSNKYRLMSHRIHPLDNPGVTLVISRDTDSRITAREVTAVNEWLLSGLPVHIIRDHPQHFPKILGGMYGLRASVNSVLTQKTWAEELDLYFSENKDVDDQAFLERMIYQKIPVEKMCIHDEIKLYEGKNCRKFPLPFERDGNYIGGYVSHLGILDPETNNTYTQYVKKYLPERISKFSQCYGTIIREIGKMYRKMYIISIVGNSLRNTLLTHFIKKTFQKTEFHVGFSTGKEPETYQTAMVRNICEFSSEPVLILHGTIQIADVYNIFQHLGMNYRTDEYTLFSPPSVVAGAPPSVVAGAPPSVVAGAPPRILRNPFIQGKVHIYIVHYSKLKNRREHLEKNLKEVGIPSSMITWIDWLDRDEVDISKYGKLALSQGNRQLTPAEVTNYMAHYYAMEQTAKIENSVSIILEDDAVLNKNFQENLQKILENIPKDWEFISICNVNPAVPLKETKEEIFISKGGTTPTCAYILNQRSAKRILETPFFPFSEPIDFAYMYIQNKIDLNVYTISPSICYEGSKFDVFPSSISPVRGF